MQMSEFIEKKRDGGVHTREELHTFIRAMVAGEIPDYMISAWLMAAFLRGLSHEETVALTLEMADSGDRLDLSSFGTATADKHSTGGVGDKTSLIVGPIAAAAGVTVAKLSGRGLGITGGTVDKLSAIPGCRVELSSAQFYETVRSTGLCIAAQSGNLAPADKILYALRDVTATVDSLPLITSSIMSKKLAAGSACIVLDVKCGAGAFMKTRGAARALARAMVEIGRSCGRRMSALVTDMATPLGLAVGNAPEVAEAVEVLSGRGPADTRTLCLALAEKMIYLAGLDTPEQCWERALVALDGGGARDKFAALIAALGGDARVARDPSLLPQAAHRRVLAAERDGFVTEVDAAAIGRTSLALGAGRKTKQDPIDLTAGILLAVKPGARVRAGAPLCTLLTSEEERLPAAAEIARTAFAIGDAAPAPTPLILETVE